MGNTKKKRERTRSRKTKKEERDGRKNVIMIKTITRKGKQRRKRTRFDNTGGQAATPQEDQL